MEFFKARSLSPYNLKRKKISFEDIPNIIRYVKKHDHKKLSSDKLYNNSVDLISSQISSIPELRKLTILIQRNFIKLNNNPINSLI